MQLTQYFYLNKIIYNIIVANPALPPQIPCSVCLICHVCIHVNTNVTTASTVKITATSKSVVSLIHWPPKFSL